MSMAPQEFNSAMNDSSEFVSAMSVTPQSYSVNVTLEFDFALSATTKEFDSAVPRKHQHLNL